MNSREVKILKNNCHYRIGDLVLRDGLRWKKDRRAIMSDSIYKKSILGEYLSKLKGKANFKLLAKICESRRSGGVPDNQLLIHIRAGDIALEPKRHESCFMFNLEKLIESIEKKTTKEIKKIKIITALHYGSNEDNGAYFFSNKSYKRNIETLDSIVSLIQSKLKISAGIDEAGLEGVELIDDHFLKLTGAKNVLIDHGSFGKVVKQVRKVAR